VAAAEMERSQAPGARGAPVPILYTIPNFTTAGSGHAMLQVVRRLDRDRFAPSIAVLKRGGHLEEEIARLNIPYMQADFTVDPRPLWSLPARARRAAGAFRGRGFVLWHSFHYLDDYTEPLVARFAGARAWVYTKKNMSWNRRSWLLRSLLARRVAAQNTDMLRNFFGGAVLRRRARLLPPSVDTDRFHPDTPPRLGLRRAHGIDPGTFVVGCVAQLVPVKDHPTLIRSLVRVPDAVLLLAGKELDPAYAGALRTLAAEAGVARRVVFLGEVRDVPALLSEIDAFVLSTRSTGEGCPVALLEAMSAGRACVATEISGVRDVLEGSEAGVRVPPGDSEALGRALSELAADPERRAALGARARRRVLERYSIEREVAAHEALYTEALGSAGGRA
jgi:glycosyltransferase involved in cell wall biosynthesis